MWRLYCGCRENGEFYMTKDGISDKKGMIIIILLIGILIFQILYTYLEYQSLESEKKSLVTEEKNLEKDRQTPERCYTILQPYNFHDKNIFIDYKENYIKIEIPRRNFSVLNVLATGSMRPTISDFSEVITINPTESDLRIGDIIIFDCTERNDSKNILHRIINIKQENGTQRYITKGDNNDVNDWDCMTSIQDITGKVIGIIY